MKIQDIVNYPLSIITDITKIQPGQAISCEYTALAGTYGTFANFGSSTKDIIDLPSALSDIDGAFLFVCIGYTPNGSLKLIADRNIQNFISWETLNNAGLCTSDGLDLTIDSLSPHESYRLLNSAEWDAVIVGYDLMGLITDKMAIWNIASSPSWTMDTSQTAANRIIRGGTNIDATADIVSTSTSGFRPVLIYNPAPKIVHRPDDETGCPLSLVTDVKRIQPGQAISCEYTATANTVGQFSNIGKATKSHISDLAPETPDGTFYFICVGYTPSGDLKLVADRNIQGKISWEKLNTAGLCTSTGNNINIDDIDGLSMRLMGTIADRHVDNPNHGEWDAIISYYDLNGLIEASDNNIWNCLTTQSWTIATLSTVDDIGTTADPVLRIARGGQDKNNLILQQSKYDSNSINEYVGFRPILIVKRESRFLYLKEDKTCYTIARTPENLQQIATDWPALDDDQKINLLRSQGNQLIGKASILKNLGKFKILAYAVGKENAASIKLLAIPHEKIILPAGLINIGNFEGIDKVLINGNFSGQGKCVVVVTVDQQNYKTYKNGAWQDIDITDISAVISDGIDTQAISSITRQEWDIITIGESGTGFAYLPIINSASDKAEIDELIMQVDMKGNWEMPIPGVDYTYCYPRNDRLKVTILTNGDYKINYTEG